jgi:acyl-CoA thioester hydrolase
VRSGVPVAALSVGSAVVTATFTYQIQVRYHEIDQQGVVFNMWYLAYLDEAMSAFIEANGLAYTQMQDDGVDVALVHTELDWTSGLRFGRAADVTVRVATVGRTSFTLDFAVQQGGENACTARIVYVCIAMDGTGKKPLPSLLRAALTDGGEG